MTTSPQWPEDPTTRGRYIDDARRARLLLRVRKLGDGRVAHEAGVGRTTVWRALAQLGMYDAGYNAIVSYSDTLDDAGERA